MILCKNKNETFKEFIYLNGGWLYYEKCPVCKMIKKSDGSNSYDFWNNHEEQPEEDIEYDYSYEFICDNEHMTEVVELSRSVEGIEVTGQTKEERIKTMKNIFNSY